MHNEVIEKVHVTNRNESELNVRFVYEDAEYLLVVERSNGSFNPLRIQLAFTDKEPNRKNLLIINKYKNCIINSLNHLLVTTALNEKESIEKKIVIKVDNNCILHLLTQDQNNLELP